MFDLHDICITLQLGRDCLEFATGGEIQSKWVESYRETM